PEIITSGYAARLWTDGDSTGQEYFLIENRQRKGFDLQLPGQGLLIWHIDETQWGNKNEYNYLVGLEQADGLFQLEKSDHYGGDINDPYPGGLGVREFSETTIPSNLTNPYPEIVGTDTFYVRDSTYIAVWDISDSDSLMYANLDVNYTRPRYVLIDYFLEESIGDGDQYIEPGETHGLSVVIANRRADAQDVYLYLDIDNELIEIQQDSILMGDLPSSDTVDNIADPIIFSVPEGMENTITELSFKVKDPSNSDSVTVVQQINLGTPKILLIDNDNLHMNEYETYYTDIFDSLKLPYIYYSLDTMGTPGPDYLNFENIVWFSSFDSLSSDDVDFLKSYLDGGGRLFLTGQNIAEGLASGPDSLFLRDYLKCDYDSSQNRYAWLYGINGSYIGSDSLRLLLTFDGAASQNSRDMLRDIDPEASANLFYVYGGEVQGVAGLEYIGSYKLVFWGFGFEGLTSISPVVSTRLQAMQKVLDFLENGISTDAEDEQEIGDHIPRQFALGQNYPNPFNPRTQISYQLDRSVDNVTLKVYNILGQEVRTLVNEPQDAGFYEVAWDSRDDNGNPVATGIYFYRLQADNLTETKKMVLLK
ncbi:MAG: T9SS type A sorting domain-containing protein, partial [Aliifodinibius sp.]|nr:T9SS type A sorting domain-containing protein [candidate division Zixibacteria bacterium]NIT54669.1 T9SS type A sorting domain-containing protein [Fodinibius sp.]NIW38924.1 T9SS type A sorting domain-containing protein [candidate division Zixibacteria bacterium]NIX54345.1 T9SS type A sorting domain-containing protein [candidate division Zixibacteria bacterium]NIY23253.1 T9SS type A sorting domain-containing protein [Fodinibius sp.]